jgi:hypothetical protein
MWVVSNDLTLISCYREVSDATIEKLKEFEGVEVKVDED